MTSVKSICTSLTALVLLAFIWGCSQSSKPISVPDNVSTVAGGYPFALQIKKRLADDAHLTAVLVDLEREGDRFHVVNLTYAFAITNGPGRIMAVTVNNLTHQACATLDAPELPKDPLIPGSIFQPLDLAKVGLEIPAVLELARTNGLAEFCALAPGQSGVVSLHLGNAATGPVWSLTGDGWDEKGPIADLAIVLDAKTGAVLRHTVQKAVNR